MFNFGLFSTHLPYLVLTLLYCAWVLAYAFGKYTDSAQKHSVNNYRIMFRKSVKDNYRRIDNFLYYYYHNSLDKVLMSYRLSVGTHKKTHANIALALPQKLEYVGKMGLFPLPPPK